MQQLTLLKTTETQTPDDRVICDTFGGKWSLLCGQYTGLARKGSNTFTGQHTHGRTVCLLENR